MLFYSKRNRGKISIPLTLTLNKFNVHERWQWERKLIKYKNKKNKGLKQEVTWLSFEMWFSVRINNLLTYFPTKILSFLQKVLIINFSTQKVHWTYNYRKKYYTGNNSDRHSFSFSGFDLLTSTMFSSSSLLTFSFHVLFITMINGYVHYQCYPTRKHHFSYKKVSRN